VTSTLPFRRRPRGGKRRVSGRRVGSGS
jgi:hypothetical protein